MIKRPLIKIPIYADCKVKDLNLLHEIMFTEIQGLKLRVNDVHRIDQVVQRLKLDTNRDKYFHNSRASLLDVNED